MNSGSKQFPPSVVTRKTFLVINSWERDKAQETRGRHVNFGRDYLLDVGIKRTWLEKYLPPSREDCEFDSQQRIYRNWKSLKRES